MPIKMDYKDTLYKLDKEPRTGFLFCHLDSPNYPKSISSIFQEAFHSQYYIFLLADYRPYGEVSKSKVKILGRGNCWLHFPGKLIIRVKDNTFNTKREFLSYSGLWPHIE